VGDAMNYCGITYPYVSSPASAGKTDAAVTFAVKMAKMGYKIIIAQPSLNCIDEWYPKAVERAGMGKEKTMEIHRFDTKTCGNGQVMLKIMDHLKQAEDGGQVVFMTQQALLGLPYFHRPDHWHLIIDEIPAPDVMFERHLPHNHEIITSAISWSDFSADNVIVQAKDTAKLRRLADNEGDDAVDAEFRVIAGKILSPDYDVYATRENIERTVAGDTEGGKYPLYLFGLLKPTVFSKFASATIMGAHFEESLLYLLWATQGVTFEPHQRITNALRFQQHPNGHRLEIYYLTEDRWSKKLGGKSVEVDGEKLTNTMLGLMKAVDLFDGEPFLYQVNKDMEEDAAKIFDGVPATALPHKPHGLNQFSNFDNVAVVASFLPPPFQYRFLSNFGITSDQIRDAICHQTTYQSVMRCSLRNLPSDSKVRVVVTDIDVAEWLEGQFPGCTISQLSGVELTPKQRGHRLRIHADNKARVHAYRERQRGHLDEIEIANLLPDIQKGKVSSLRLANNIYSSNVTLRTDHLTEVDTTTTDFMDLSVLDDSLFVGSLFRHKKDVNTNRHVLFKSMNSMIEWLSRCHGLTYKDKDSNYLISPTLFNPTLGDKCRGRANAVLTWGFWLDIDVGDLDYHVFQKMFPGIKMVIYNTASSTNDTRYRVFMPTSSYMMTDTYSAICKQVVHRVQLGGFCSPRQKKHGSPKPCHGIDPSKISVENMMYLPCRPFDGSKGFFEVYDGELLDPGRWVQNSILPVYVPAPVLEAAATDADLYFSNSDAVLKFERMVTALTDEGIGNRNHALYRAAKNGFAMASAGLMDAYEVETRLKQAAFQAGLERDEIPATIESGRKNSGQILGRYLRKAA
jgi:hypothetical protein